MKQSVSVLSDLHIDFYIHQKDPKRIKRTFVESAYEDVLDADPEVDVLIVAGDIGHHNAQSFKVLSIIADIFNYMKIFVVAGNHDEYSSSSYGSQKRFKEFREYADPEGIIEVLDGNVVEYNGIRYGGCEMNYDGSYLKTLGSQLDATDYWRYSLNDSKYQHRVDFIPKYLNELQKLHRINKECDVMITHINPSNLQEHQLPEYSKELSTAFYNFDGLQLLKQTTAQYWFYGHCHGHLQYDYEGTKCVLNANGYPREPKTWLTMDLEIKENE